MKVDLHISELLLDHDCVIVPAFGGFLASYQHAVIHPTRHTFSPPSKKIAFNIFLNHNDGLLAHHIAGQANVSYTDAVREIGFFVTHCQEELHEGKKIILEQIGTLYFDKEKNLQFEAFKNINYLRDAFGCDTVQFLPVKRKGQQPVEQWQLKGSDSLRASEKPEQVPLKISVRSEKKTLPIVIVTGALIWFVLNLYFISPKQLNLSALNPFAPKKNTEIVNKVTQPAGKQQATIQPSIIETTLAVPANALENTVAVSSKESLEIMPAVAPVMNAIPTIENKKFFIVGGAFQFRENAVAFVKTLQADGFENAQILDSTRRLKMVCFNGYSSFEKASTELNRLTTMGKSAWIYAR